VAERPDRSPLRQATLANQVERFLLETMAGGYEASEVEQALRMALDHWHAMASVPLAAPWSRASLSSAATIRPFLCWRAL